MRKTKLPIVEESTAAGPPEPSPASVKSIATDIEQGLTDQRLFARWAGEDLPSWERAVGATVTHLSRGKGVVTNVTRETGAIAIHVAYERSQFVHATWELRTEFTRMTLPPGLTRAEITPGARDWRLLEAERARDNRQVIASAWRGYSA